MFDWDKEYFPDETWKMTFEERPLHPLTATSKWITRHDGESTITFIPRTVTQCPIGPPPTPRETIDEVWPQW